LAYSAENLQKMIGKDPISPQLHRRDTLPTSKVTRS